MIFRYHRRFIEVVNSFYLSKLNSTERSSLFSNVIEFFNETWKGKNKPFKIENKKLIEKYKLDESNGEMQGNTLTTSQPIEFIDADGNVQYNKRKLNELPLFLKQLGSSIAIPLAATEICFNYEFMCKFFMITQ